MMRTSEIDWNELWRVQLTDSFKNKADGGEIECSCYWDSVESARNYLKTYGIDPSDKTGRITLLNNLLLSPDYKVLEIGPGPGVLTLPIARKAKHITAIEPAKGMFQVLEERVIEERLTNITLINNRWEDVDVSSISGDFDLVIASFSLGMSDIRDALVKMSSVCKGDVVLFWHADIPQFEALYSMVWPSLYGREYVSGPKSDVLFNILYQMKIYPTVSYHENYQHQVFSSFQELMNYFTYQHCLECDPSNECFKKYLEQYVTEKNGGYTHHERLPYMMFRWHGEKNPDKGLSSDLILRGVKM